MPQLAIASLVGLLAAYSLSAMHQSWPLEDGAIELKSSQLTESSGVAVSHLTPDVIWTHNDSGDRSRLFAFDVQGNCLAELMLRGVKAVDWEDLCSFEAGGKAYLAVGDVGDNNRRRKSVFIHVVEEPVLNVPAAEQPTKAGNSPPAAPPAMLETATITTIEVRYPKAVDCESLAYDPRRREFLLCSKEPLRTGLYRVPFNLDAAKQTVEVTENQVLGVPLATAADISQDGQLLVICSYGPAFLTSRSSSGDNAQGDELDTPWEVQSEQLRVIQLPVRRQGESICFSADAQQLMLTSEHHPTPFWSIPIDAQP